MAGIRFPLSIASRVLWFSTIRREQFPNNFANPPGDTLVSLTCTDGIRTAPPTLCQHKSLGCLNTPVKMTMVTNCEQGNQNFMYNTYICCQDNP